MVGAQPDAGPDGRGERILNPIPTLAEPPFSFHGSRQKPSIEGKTGGGPKQVSQGESQVHGSAPVTWPAPDSNRDERRAMDRDDGAALQTEDLYLAGLCLLRGGELAGAFVRGNDGRRVVVFRIEGEAAVEAGREYRRGPALVDLRLLASEVRRLKDVLFDALREDEMRRRKHDERGDRSDHRREPDRAGDR